MEWAFKDCSHRLASSVSEESADLELEADLRKRSDNRRALAIAVTDGNLPDTFQVYKLGLGDDDEGRRWSPDEVTN